MAAFSLQNSYTSSAIGASDTTITLINGTTYPSSGTVTIESEDITYTSVSGNTLSGCTRGANSTTPATHPVYAAVTLKTPSQVMYHEYGVDDVSVPTSAAIDSYIESSDFDIGDGHNYSFVWRVLPDVSFTGSSSGSPRVFLTVNPRQNSGTNYSNPAPNSVTRTSATPVDQYTGEVFTRVRGRQMSFKIESTDLGTAWSMGAMRVDIRQDGRR